MKTGIRVSQRETFRTGWRSATRIASHRQINVELAKRASKWLGTTGNKISPRRHFYLPMLLHSQRFTRVCILTFTFANTTC